MSPCGQVGRQVLADAEDAFGPAKQAHRQVEQVDAGCRHPAGGRLIGLQTPVVAVEREELVVAEVRFDLLNAPELSGVGLRQQGRDRGVQPPLVAHAENQARVPAPVDGLLGPGLGQGKRLFAEDMLSGSHRRLDLRLVQSVRRCQHDRLDRRIVQRVGVVSGQRNSLFGAKRPHRLEIGLDRMHHLDVLPAPLRERSAFSCPTSPCRPGQFRLARSYPAGPVQAAVADRPASAGRQTGVASQRLAARDDAVHGSLLEHQLTPSGLSAGAQARGRSGRVPRQVIPRALPEPEAGGARFSEPARAPPSRRERRAG